MKAPSDLKAALWGAAAGAAALAVVGFMLTGWVTQRAAEATARRHASGDVVAALARTCADRFKQQADVATRLDRLKAIGTGQQGPFVEMGGWATPPGSTPDAAVAKVCAEMLAEDP